ncbi:hypothetical protein EAE99_011602 [Botrytis elliptica]|nr:hypothetical protein EAE99_011602 [Botrytis elliptica]
MSDKGFEGPTQSPVLNGTSVSSDDMSVKRVQGPTVLYAVLFQNPMLPPAELSQSPVLDGSPVLSSAELSQSPVLDGSPVLSSAELSQSPVLDGSPGLSSAELSQSPVLNGTSALSGDVSAKRVKKSDDDDEKEVKSIFLFLPKPSSATPKSMIPSHKLVRVSHQDDTREEYQ